MRRFLPRRMVHANAEDIHANPGEHRAAITRLVRAHRKLARFVDDNAKTLTIVSRKTPVYLVGVTARLFDLAGGRLGVAGWAQIQEAERKVGAAAPSLFPLDEGFAERLRLVPDRAQPHLLDDMVDQLFEEAEDRNQAAKLFFLMWVVVEVLDAAWTPPKDFAGDDRYEPVTLPRSPLREPPP